MAVAGLYRRLANSLFVEWRSHQNNPQYLTTTDFAVDMAAEGHCRALNMITTIHPSFTRAPQPSWPSLQSPRDQASKASPQTSAQIRFPAA
jgi:hypothetical protein